MQPKPFWRSKTLWGAFCLLVATILGAVGVEVSADEQASLVVAILDVIEAGGKIVGLVLVVWGRFTAARPIAVRVPKAPMIVLALLLVGAPLGLVACATPPQTPAGIAVAAGLTLETAGQEFVKTGALYDRLERARAIPRTDYDRWGAFATRFQATWAPTYAAWQRGGSGEGDLKQRLVALKDELLVYVLLVHGKE